MPSLLRQEFGGGRVPIVIRQRYLNILIDETLKLHPEDEDEAFKKGMFKPVRPFF